MKHIILLLFMFTFMYGTKETGINLFYSKCSTCHGTKVSLEKVKTEEQWKSTIKRMEKHGLNIKKYETEKIAEFLAERSQ